MDHRPLWSFQGPHAGVTVNSHHQQIPQRGRLLQVGDMAHMEQIEAAVGKDDALTELPLRLDFCYIT